MKVGLTIEQRMQAGANRPMVVSEQNMDRLGRLRPESSSHGPPYPGACAAVKLSQHKTLQSVVASEGNPLARALVTLVTGHG